MRIETFRMERMQCLYEHEVEYNLSESGVQPMTLEELLGGEQAVRAFLSTEIGYPQSNGSLTLRERIASFYPGADADNVTVVNGGSEANHITLWTLLEGSDRLAFMIPNYMQGWGLGRHYGAGTDTFRLRVRHEDGRRRWALDLDQLNRAVSRDTKVILVTNPNNPTGSVLTEEEMDAVEAVARRAGAWLVSDEIYRGAELHASVTPTFWGRYDRVVVTSGLSKAFGLPGLRVGWMVAPPKLIEKLWIHHDYTTLTPGALSERLASLALNPPRREAILARTRGILRRNLPIREVRPADPIDRPHRSDPRGAVGAARAGGSARGGEIHPVRLWLGRRVHAEGTGQGRRDPCPDQLKGSPTGEFRAMPFDDRLAIDPRRQCSERPIGLVGQSRGEKRFGDTWG